MKLRYLIALAATFALAACDRKNETAAIEAEKQKLEAERVKLASEKERFAAEHALTLKQIAVDAENRRLERERDILDADKAKLAAEQAKLDADKTVKAEAERQARQEAMVRLDETRADLAIAAAKSVEERARLTDLKNAAEAERKAADRASSEARVREDMAKRAQAATAGPTIALFYNALDAHGEWADTDRYGYVWQPKTAQHNKSWRPYTDGRWQWTDYGWTWQSNESFGWATYHYGRWAKLPQLGWVWVPGSEWAPAWVSWRVRGVQYVGWAPLPPEAYSAHGYGATVDEYFDIGPWSYVLLELKDFDAPSYVQKILPAEKHMEMLAATRNVTDMSYRQIGGRAVLVCGGPDSFLLSSALRELRNTPDDQPIPRVSLMLMNQPATTSSPDVMNAGALMLFAPLLEHRLPTAKPAAPGKKLLVKEVERGWSDSKPWEENQWRDNLKREARTHEVAQKAVAARAVTPKPVAPPTPPKAAADTTPATVEKKRPSPQATPTPKPGALAPAKIQPSSGIRQ